VSDSPAGLEVSLPPSFGPSRSRRKSGSGENSRPVAARPPDLERKKTRRFSSFLQKRPYLATSVPERSSLGSGSVYPRAFASATTSAKLRPGDSELKM
jgi:hypothetical protein